MKTTDDFPDRKKAVRNLFDAIRAKMILSQLGTHLNRRKSFAGWFYRFSRY